MFIKAMLVFFLLMPQLATTENKIIDLDTFIKTALEKDDHFQTILINQLAIKYNKDLKLPPQALITNIKSQYGTSIDQNNNGINSTISLEKLFRNSGTTVSTTYNNVNYSTNAQGRDSLSLSISQDIAKNAFGKMIRKETTMIGMENEVMEYQAIEAYEDYLSSLLFSYQDWYLAYQNKITSESFLINAQKQEANIKARWKKNIANKIEMDKMTLQTLSRKELFLSSKSIYSSKLLQIKEIMRDNSKLDYEPKEAFKYIDKNISFDEDFNFFTLNARTFKILTLLEKSQNTQLSYNIDDLLPSAQILIDSTISSPDGIFNNQNTKSFYTGFTLSYPFGDSQKRAKIAISRLELKKTQLTITEKQSSLRSQLYELYNSILEKKEQRELIKQKIVSADNIYKEEEKNYNQGRSKINDLISAGNDLESYRFALLSTEVTLNKLVIEWLRITDKLIEKINQDS